jgi:sulfite exporter TauE/SafE
MTPAIQGAAVTMTGLLAGNELGTLIGSHPALRTLSPQTEVEAERALTRHLGRVMPYYMTGTLVAAVAAAVDRRGDEGARRAAAGATASAVMLTITLLGNVPLNKRTLDYPSDGDRHEWERIRRRWELLHGARVLLDLAAFGCFTSALAAR